MGHTRTKARLKALGATTLLPATLLASSLLGHGSSRAIAGGTTLPTVPDCVRVTQEPPTPPITVEVCP